MTCEQLHLVGKACDQHNFESGAIFFGGIAIAMILMLLYGLVSDLVGRK